MSYVSENGMFLAGNEVGLLWYLKSNLGLHSQSHPVPSQECAGMI